MERTSSGSAAGHDNSGARCCGERGPRHDAYFFEDVEALDGEVFAVPDILCAAHHLKDHARESGPNHGHSRKVSVDRERGGARQSVCGVAEAERVEGTRTADAPRPSSSQKRKWSAVICISSTSTASALSPADRRSEARTATNRGAASHGKKKKKEKKVVMMKSCVRG